MDRRDQEHRGHEGDEQEPTVEQGTAHLGERHEHAHYSRQRHGTRDVEQRAGDTRRPPSGEPGGRQCHSQRDADQQCDDAGVGAVVDPRAVSAPASNSTHASAADARAPATTPAISVRRRMPTTTSSAASTSGHTR